MQSAIYVRVVDVGWSRDVGSVSESEVCIKLVVFIT
jgi:hypothetical protein